MLNHLISPITLAPQFLTNQQLISRIETPPSVATMPPASKEYRDIESGRNNGRAKTSRGSHAYYQNSIVRHENETRPNTDDALLGSRPNRTRSNKNPTNPMKRLLRIPFGNSSKKSTRNSEETAIVPYDQDLKTGGTFETSSATETTNASYEPYEHPRSQKRMMEKWGKLRDEMSSNSPDSWVKSLEFAQQMAYGKDGGDSFNRDKLVKEAQDKIRNMMDFSIWHCLFAIALYVAVSVLCFSYWLETWSIVDSAYFSIVTFTTIGYGDLFPDTPRARLFTCFWALSGVACLGIALGVLGTQLIAVAESEKKKATHKQQKEVIGMFNPDDVPLEHRRGDEDTTTSQWSDLGYRGAEDYLLSQDDQDEEEPSRCRSCMSSPKTRRFVLLFTVLVVILFLMCAAEGWTVRSTIYYGLITGKLTWL